MMLRAGLLALVVAFTPLSADARASIDYPIVKLRSLDKVTARTQVFEAQVGKTVKFGSVYIRVQACRKAPEFEQPESAAFLQVWEAVNEDGIAQNDQPESEWIFSGWMFGSSPGLSAMDHPIYDVWVLDCLKPESEQDQDTVAEDGEGEGEEATIEITMPDSAEDAMQAPAAEEQAQEQADEQEKATQNLLKNLLNPDETPELADPDDAQNLAPQD